MADPAHTTTPWQPAPGKELSAVLPQLRRPFTPEAVRFKIQTNPRGATGKALVVAYIDARHVGSRLNLTVPAEWSSEFEEVQGGVKCLLTVCGQTRCDVGWSKGTGTDIDLKARYSDALKRAAVHFGIGEFLYALPQVKLPARDLDSWGEPKKFALGTKAMDGLRKSYAAWLKSERNIFGEPKDHGDAADSQGDVEVQERLDTESLLPANDKPLNA